MLSLDLIHQLLVVVNHTSKLTLDGVLLALVNSFRRFVQLRPALRLGIATHERLKLLGDGLGLLPLIRVFQIQLSQILSEAREPSSSSSCEGCHPVP